MSEILAVVAIWNLAGLAVSSYIAIAVDDETQLKFIASMLLYPCGFLTWVIFAVQWYRSR